MPGSIREADGCSRKSYGDEIPSRRSTLKLLQKAALARTANFNDTFVMTDKQLVLNAVQEMPDEAVIDEITERIEFIAAVRKGSGQIKQGKVVPHEEVKRRMAEWMPK